MIALSRFKSKNESENNQLIPYSRFVTPSSQNQEKSKENAGIWDTLKNTASDFIDNNISNIGLAFGTAAEGIGNAVQSLNETLDFGEDSWRTRALNAIADEYQTRGGKAVEDAKNRSRPADKDSYIGALSNATRAGALGVVGNLASMAHADTGSDAINQIVQDLLPQERAPVELSWDYFSAPNGFATDFGNLVGSMGVLAPLTMAVPEAGAASVVAKLDGNRITQGLIDNGYTQLAKLFAKGAPNVLRYTATSAPIESLAEGGGTRRELLAQGFSDDEATERSLITAAENLPLLLGTNFLEGLAFGMPLAKGGKFFTGAQIAGRGVGNAFSQSTEEALQKAVSNSQENKPYGVLPWDWTDDQQEEFERAFFPSLALAGIPAAGRAVIGSKDNATEDWQRGTSENISNDDYSARAQNQSNQTQRANLRTWANDISGNQMSGEVYNLIVQSAQRHGVPVKHALAQAFAESQGNPNAISPVGAIGVMQLMPETAESLGVDPNNLEQNIDAGVRYLKQQYDTFGDWNLAHAAYNAGAGAVERAGGIPNYAETQDYVKKNQRLA